MYGFRSLGKSMCMRNWCTYVYNNPDKPFDQELIVRSAHCSALMPTMQASVARRRVLSEENLAICREMALLHE